MAREPEKTTDSCLRCGRPLYTFGVQEFRLGGTTGSWKLLFGEWAELGEDMIGLEVLACRGCGKVEMRIPDQG